MTTLQLGLKLLKQHRRWVLVGWLLAFATVAGGIGLLSVAGWFISASAFAGLAVMSALAFNYFLPSAGVRFFALLRLLSRYGERVVTHDITFKMLVDLRVWVYQLLEPLAPAHLLRYQSGDLLNRMISDIDALDQLYSRVLLPFAVTLGVMVVVVVYFSFFSPTIALTVLALMAIMLLGVPVLSARLGHQASQEQLWRGARLRTQMVDSVQGLGDWLLLGQWPTRVTQLLASSQAWLNTQARLGQVQGLVSACWVLLSGLALWCAVYLSIPLVSSRQLSGADIALLGLGALAAFEALQPMAMALQYWGKIRAAVGRLDALAREKPEVQFPAHSSVLPTQYDLELKAVDFAYQAAFPVLQQFNLRVAMGETVALVGPTGVGKSTVAHLCARFVAPQQGAITIGGVAIETLAEADLRGLLTLITQRPHLFNASLRDNLRLGKATATDDELQAALAQSQLQEWSETLAEGLDTWLGETGVQLSGGQLRRLAIARAILHGAPIWILDEPTEGLDHATEQALWQTLTPLLKTKTVLVITHQLANMPTPDRVVSCSLLLEGGGGKGSEDFKLFEGYSKKQSAVMSDHTRPSRYAEACRP